MLNQMNKPQNIRYFLVLNQLTVRDANAISGNLIYGFPALTAVEGFVHALNRALLQRVKTKTVESENHPLSQVRYQNWMVIAHTCEAKIYREHAGRDYTFLQKKAPLTRTGSNPPIIEEGRIDVTLSLVIEMSVLNSLTEEEKAEGSVIIKEWLAQSRFAGGIVESYKSVSWLEQKVDDKEMKREIIQQVGSGYILCSAEELLGELLDAEQEQAEIDPNYQPKDALDLLLDTARTYYQRPKDIDSAWQFKRLQQGKGYIVPLMVGYQPVSQLFESNQLKTVRKPEYPTEFVEPLYGLGQWIPIYRLLSGDKTEPLKRYFWINKAEEGRYLLIGAEASHE